MDMTMHKIDIDIIQFHPLQACLQHLRWRRRRAEHIRHVLYHETLCLDNELLPGYTLD